MVLVAIVQMCFSRSYGDLRFSFDKWSDW